MPDFIFTHVNQLIEIQELAIRRNYNEVSDAGCEGVVRDGAMGWLESIIDRPYWDPQLKTNVMKYSAYVLHTIATRHPFGQANKRTAFAAAENCLLLCGFRVDAGEEELEDFMLRYTRSGGRIENFNRAMQQWSRDASVSVVNQMAAKMTPYAEKLRSIMGGEMLEDYRYTEE